MDSTQVALDTNVVIRLTKGDLRVAEQLLTFTTLLLPAPVAGELLFGALNSPRPAYHLARERAFIAGLTLLPVDATSAEHYAALRLALKQRGRPILENDRWIAAICLAHDAALFTLDKHFAEVPGLQLVGA